MILVTGSTGKIGQEVVSRLLDRHAEVRAFVRDAAKGARLLGPKVQLAEGDLNDAASMERALLGVDTVFLLSNANGAQEMALIDQAVKAGVKRLVKISSIGASPESAISLGRTHAEVEAKLRASPLAWTILQPGMFAQNLLMSAQTIRGEGRFFGAYGEGKIAPIDVRDIAEVAVLALTTEGHEGKTYRLTGPEALTHRLLAEKLSAATGKKIEYVNLPADVVREGMKKAFAASGMPLWLADDLVKMQEGIASGGAGMVTDEVPRLLGRPARTFDDFARDQAAAFGG